MCGRYTLRTPWRRISEYFGIPIADVPELFVPRFNIAPTQQVLAARHLIAAATTSLHRQLDLQRHD
jgi:putative SOS response-associated peptidase YedK